MSRVPEAASFSSACELADALETFARGEPNGNLRVREEFGLVASSPRGREALIALLGRAGASDEVRLATLDALEPKVTPADAPELARINTGQRPAVLSRALDVIAATACGMALFALRKVYGVREESRPVAMQLAVDLEQLLPEAIALRQGAARSDALDDRELLLCALALPLTRQFDLTQSLLSRLSGSAVELDSELRSKGTSSAGRFHAQLRDELLTFALIAPLENEALQERALDNLFRRDVNGETRAVVSALPDRALEIYSERALTRQNRRGRPDRAAAALEMSALRDDQGPDLLAAALDALGDEVLRCASKPRSCSPGTRTSSSRASKSFCWRPMRHCRRRSSAGWQRVSTSPP